MNSAEEVGEELPELSRLLRSCLLASAGFASAALALFGSCLGNQLGPYLLENQLPPRMRGTLLASMGALAALGAALTWRLHKQSGPARAESFARRRAPLLALALAPFLAQERFFRGRELTFLLLILVFGATLFQGLSVALSEGAFCGTRKRLRWIADRLPRLTPLALTIAIACGYATYFGWATISSHHNFCTSAFDLGIEDNLLWNAAHGGPLFRSAPLGGNMLHGGFHQTYFAYVLVPIYALLPRAETLLAIQATFLGAATLPLYVFATRRVGSWAALLIVCTYVFYAPLHGANLYDFHYQPFGVFFTFLCAALLEARDPKSARWFWLIVPLMLSVREDMGAMLGALGGFYALSGRNVRLGLLLAVLGSAYFIALKLVIMPHLFLGGQSSFSFMFKDLLPKGETGFGGVLKTLLGNPAYAAETLFTREKLYYLLQLFVPVLFLSLRRPRALLLFGPGAVFTLLSTGYPALTMTSFQYTAYWTPMVFLGFIEYLSGRSASQANGLAPAIRKAALLAVFASTLLCSHRFGAILQTETAQGAFDPVRIQATEEDRKNLADFEALVAQIPKEAKVVAAEWLVSHVSNRRDAYTLRFGVLDAEYLLFWTHPQKLRSDERPILRRALQGRGADFGVVEQRGIFYLAKRGYDKSKNSELKRAL